MRYLKVYESFISDDEIHEICKKYNIEDYTINNGIVDVNGDVDLAYQKITKLPLNFGKVIGSFDCSNNQLTTLKGCPVEVYKDFFCHNNKLTSLDYCPMKVNNIFDCSLNELTLLKGCPSEVNSFSCNDNKLKTLEGCPSRVEEDIFCYNNTYLYDFNDICYIGDSIMCDNTIIEEVWKLFQDVSKIELLNYIDPFRPAEVEGGKPICYLDKLNIFLEQIGKPTIITLKNYECI